MTATASAGAVSAEPDVRSAALTNEEMRGEYAKALIQYKAKESAWRSKGGQGEPPNEPERPKYARWVVKNATMESLLATLADNPRGLSLVRDELSALFGSFNAYRQGKGDDVQTWLEFYDAGSVCIDRKMTQGAPIRIPRAVVNVTGGIQPKTLRACLGNEHVANGLLARFNLHMPPLTSEEWSEDEVSDATQASVDALFTKLSKLGFGCEEDGVPQPLDLRWAEDAKPAWVKFHNEQKRELRDMPDAPFRSYFSKTIGTTARLAMLLHLARWADDPTAVINSDRVDAESVRRAIQVSRWWINETRRCYVACGFAPKPTGEDPEAELEGLLKDVEWMRGRRHEDSWSASELKRNRHHLRDLEIKEIESRMRRIITLGLAEVEPSAGAFRIKLLNVGSPILN